MGVFDDKMTGLADVFRRKFSTEETLTIDAMSQLLFNADIGEGGSGGVDVSGVTATPATVLNTVKFVDNLGRLLDGEIETVTPQVTDNVFSVAKGYISNNVTLEVAEMSEPSLSANVVTIGKGYNKTQKTVTVAEAPDLSVSDNVVTVQVGYIKTPRTATVAVAENPTVTDNRVTVHKGYQSEQKTLTVTEAAAPTVSGNQVTLHKGYNPQELTITVEGGADIPDGYADVSGVTATPNDVLMTARFVNSNGELQDGAIQPVTAYLTDNVFEVEEGFIGSTTLTVPEAATPTVNGNQVTIYKGYNRAEQTITVENSGGGDGTVSEFGYWTEDGKFQKVDLSGSQPVNVGAAETVEDGAVFLFATGQAEPDYEIPVPGGGGIEFYECATYTPDADAYIRYTVTLSDAPDANANTTYERKRFVENPDPDNYAVTAKWQAENGYYIEENYGYGEWSYYIKTKDGYTKYTADMLSSRVTDFRTVSWMDSDIYESVTLTFSAVQEENIPATTEGWTGRKVTQDAETGAWITAEEITPNLTVAHLKPKVGEIYSADTTIRVRKMYNGSVFPIPSDGLVFYAPLQSDSIDVIGNTTGEADGASFTSFVGVECAYLNGNAMVKWGGNQSIPQGSSPISLVAMFAQTESRDWHFIFGISPDNNRNAGLSLQNKYTAVASNIAGSDYITQEQLALSEWHTAILTVSNSTAIWYVDGSQANIVNSVSLATNPQLVYAGADLGQSARHYFIGYIAHTAVYNRALTSDEVAEIHAALMEDVQQ